MPRLYPFSHSLPDERRVPYSLKSRGAYLMALFVGPAGNRLEKSTGETTLADAHAGARRLIEKIFAPAPDSAAARAVATWEEALAHLEGTPDLRPDSVRAYGTAVRAVRQIFPEVTGPAGVTVELAHKFKREFLRQSYARGTASDAATYKRAPTTALTYLRSLRSLWAKHFKPAGFVRDNPWKEVPYPNISRGRRVRVPEEAAIGDFFAWLERRHPGWELPRLFVTVKMLAGCRTLDLCLARSVDLGPTSLTLSESATKTREARTIDLPPDVIAALRRVAGPRWLWERAPAECFVHRPSPRVKARGLKAPYDASSWRWTVANLFREFNEGRAPSARLRPHDLRARAITIVAAASQSVDATAQAMGVDVQTARHYLDSAKAFDGRAVLRLATDLLRGPAAQKEGGESGGP